MSGGQAIGDRYQKQYADLAFERSGLFQVLLDSFHSREVLYPGCSIHVTPAFFFPHVVFVDQAPAAASFFSDRELVLDLIKRQQRYRETPYVQFLAQDYTRPLPVGQMRFDLVLAIYAGGVARACKGYLKMGGILVTNNHHNDAVEAMADNELTLIALVQHERGRYRLQEIEPAGSVPPPPITAGHPGRNLRRSPKGLEYVERERYYVFQRGRQ